MNYPVNLEDNFCKYLVSTYVCLNVKYQKISCNFCTKICYSVNNYIQHEKKPHQEVEDGYIFVKTLRCLCPSSD